MVTRTLLFPWKVQTELAENGSAQVVYEATIANQLPKEESFDLFRSLVLKHSCQRPPCAGRAADHDPEWLR